MPKGKFADSGPSQKDLKRFVETVKRWAKLQYGTMDGFFVHLPRVRQTVYNHLKDTDRLTVAELRKIRQTLKVEKHEFMERLEPLL